MTRRSTPRVSPARAGRPAGRRRFVLAFWLLAGLVLVLRALQVQVVQGPAWSQVAENQQRRTVKVPAARGSILDRNGAALAASQERMRVAVAPSEIKDREQAEARLVEALGISRSEARSVVRSERRWKYVPGDFSPSVREAFEGVSGIHTERVMRRVYPAGMRGTVLLGTLQDGQATGGIEQMFDEILSGEPGEEVSARDGGGREIPGETWMVRPPVAGGSVALTLDQDVQEIAVEALRAQIASTQASGGDLIVVDPRTGEVLAMVSLRADNKPALSAINAPYEPGSTIKPLIVVALLEHGVARLSDSIDTGNGTWTVNGRTVHDTSPHGHFTLADALRVSSNVGLAKAAQALTPEALYGSLRDFGLGTYTGVPLAGEGRGVLRDPSRWSGQSAVSHAIGYEVNVTPIQMTMAYAALANGGKLMEPILVREVRDATGRIVERGRPRVVRSVASEEVVASVREVLVDVVEDGTGTRAAMSTFRVAGKSGTSRAYGVGGYEPNAYYSSFVGFFPADDPQLVVYVKLDRPRGAYYGGSVAAPVTLATLESILAARGTPLDRSALAQTTRRAEAAPVPSRVRGPFRFAGRGAPEPAPVPPNPWAALPSPEPVPAATPTEGALRVPDLRGLSARVAVRRLHASGFRVRWSGEGIVSGTRPGSGSIAAPGDTIQIVASSSRDGRRAGRP